MGNWYKLADRSLNCIFDSRLYQEVTSLGPIKIPVNMRGYAHEGLSKVDSLSPSLELRLPLGNTRLNERNWTRGMNGFFQAGAICLISTVSLVIFRNKRIAAAGIGFSLGWMGIAVHHLFKYGNGDHFNYSHRVKGFWV